MRPESSSAQVHTTTIDKSPLWVAGASAIVRRLPFGRYRSLKYLSSLRKTPFLSRLPTCYGGAAFIADLRDSICSEVCFTGKYEPQETLLLKHILGPGMSFLDVGANWGYFTLMASAQVGITGKVVALEPDPRLYRTLCQNVAKNQFPQTTTLPVAAAASECILSLQGHDRSGSNWGISKIVNQRQNDDLCFEVKGVSLDEIVSKYYPSGVDVMKIDIEGAEEMALRGLYKSLREKACRCILLELHPALLESFGSNSRAALDPLLENEYQLYRIDHSFETTRSLSYSRHKSAAGLVSQLDNKDGLDAWPHLLCVAPNVMLNQLLS